MIRMEVILLAAHAARRENVSGIGVETGRGQA